jgi:hypothetical protein
MDIHHIAEELGPLMLLDFDAAHAYEEAIEKLQPADIREQYTRFRIDHQDQVFGLSTLIKQLGEEPPAHSNDFSRYATDAIASPKEYAETRQIIDVMYRNEQLIGRRYAALLKTGLPAAVREGIQKGFTLEERHLAYMESLLSLSPIGR